MKIGKFVIITKKEYDRLQKDSQAIQTLRKAKAEAIAKNKNRIDNERANRAISNALSQFGYFPEVDA